MDFHQIKSIIDKHDKIFISSHINPDGDSLGSAYAMYKYLDSIGKIALSLITLQYQKYIIF